MCNKFGESYEIKSLCRSGEGGLGLGGGDNIFAVLVWIYSVQILLVTFCRKIILKKSVNFSETLHPWILPFNPFVSFIRCKNADFNFKLIFFTSVWTSFEICGGFLPLPVSRQLRGERKWVKAEMGDDHSLDVTTLTSAISNKMPQKKHTFFV